MAEEWRLSTELYRGQEGAIRRNVAVGHTRGVEGEAREAAAIEEDEAAGRLGFCSEQGDRLLRTFCSVRFGATQQVNRKLGHHDFHDGFAVAGGRGGAGFEVGVAAAADQRGVADAAGEFAAGAAGGGGGE